MTVSPLPIKTIAKLIATMLTNTKPQAFGVSVIVKGRPTFSQKSASCKQNHPLIAFELTANVVAL